MLKPEINNRLIFLLSLFGLIVAGYVLQGYLRQSSVYCPVGGGCDLVRKSPYAWPFGIPVPAFGFVGYLTILSLSFFKTAIADAKKRYDVSLWIAGIATFGVGFVTWFTLTEAFLIGGFCSWCVVSAIVMYFIFGLVLTDIYQGKKSSSSASSRKVLLS